MIISWSEKGWDDYLYWQKTNKKMLTRINTLIQAITRQPFDGIGSPESLKHHWSGYWSRRIDLEHRLIYKVIDGTISIAQCHYHYG